MNEISAERLQEEQVAEPRMTALPPSAPAMETVIGAMRCSPNGTGNLDKALATAQAEFPVLERNRTVTVTKRAGGEYKFKYATFDHIVHIHRPILGQHGLALTQAIAQHPRGGLVLCTRLAHGDSGEWTMETLPLPDIAGEPQAFGSAVTYLKRYAYCAKLCIAAEDDDDGNSAQGNSVQVVEDRTQRPVQPQQPAPRLQAPPQRPALGDSMPGGVVPPIKRVEPVRDHPPVDAVLRLVTKIGSPEEEIRAVDNKSLDTVWKQRFMACLEACKTQKAVAGWLEENGPFLNEADALIPAAVVEMQNFHNQYIKDLPRG